jgi:hypothetical protein
MECRSLGIILAWLFLAVLGFFLLEKRYWSHDPAIRPGEPRVHPLGHSGGNSRG